MFTFALSVGLATLTIARLPDGRGSGSVRRASSATTRPANFPPLRRDFPRRLRTRLPEDAPSSDAPSPDAAAGSDAAPADSPGSSSSA
jgi:hypothetical protein